MAGRLSGNFYVSITKKQNRRTQQQNKYLFGVVYVCVANGIRESWGESMTTDEAHVYCKDRFLSRPVIDRNTGEIKGKTFPTSKTLSISEFSEYIEKISRFAAESLSVVIPPANSI